MSRIPNFMKNVKTNLFSCIGIDDSLDCKHVDPSLAENDLAYRGQFLIAIPLLAIPLVASWIFSYNVGDVLFSFP